MFNQQGVAAMDSKASGITDIVLGVLRDCLEPAGEWEEITPQTALSHLHIDSLRMVQIVYELETLFGVELPEHALFQLETIKDLTNLLRLTLSTSAKNGGAYPDQG
jgi:acyl carrier protein